MSLAGSKIDSSILEANACTFLHITESISAMPLLDVRNLTTRFHTRNGIVHAVENVSFQVDPGQTLGIVGESGSADKPSSTASTSSPFLKNNFAKSAANGSR